MENLIPVLVIGAIVGFLLWKNKDKLVSAVEKIKGQVQKPHEPEVGTTAPVPGTPAPASAPAPVSVPAYNGVGDPPSQEAWTAWLATLPPSTRAFYPPIWKITPKDNPDFGPFPEIDIEDYKGKHFTNGSERVDLTTEFKSVPIKHPKNFKGKLKVTVVESVDSKAGNSVRYIVEIAGDNVQPNHYEWGYTGGGVNMEIEGNSHEIRIKANKPAQCVVWYGWAKA